MIQVPSEALSSVCVGWRGAVAECMQMHMQMRMPVWRVRKLIHAALFSIEGQNLNSYELGLTHQVVTLAFITLFKPRLILTPELTWLLI